MRINLQTKWDSIGIRLERLPFEIGPENDPAPAWMVVAGIKSNKNVPRNLPGPPGNMDVAHTRPNQSPKRKASSNLKRTLCDEKKY